MRANPETAITRRALLRGAWVRASSPAKLVAPEPTAPELPVPGTRRGDPLSLPLLRPPGAVPEDEFLSRCTRCAECIKACPHGAIAPAPSRFRRAEGTPWIDAVRNPCRYCADAPCIAACGEGALSPDAPRRMGTARIIELACLSHRSLACTVCSERCPVPGAVRVNDGRVQIEEQICTGCGVCAHVCPAPDRAILLMPASTRR